MEEESLTQELEKVDEQAEDELGQAQVMLDVIVEVRVEIGVVEEDGVQLITRWWVVGWLDVGWCD